ncbi:hypothetical protein AURDEDRAFT_121515 [Auricularia subglabra TFB-10046 SS5]|nr:hypothetical protein AURDEDRAFT_121515 [Auricularia subglabra TFB-10046 SS5]
MTSLLAVLLSALAAALASPTSVVNTLVARREVAHEGNTHLDVPLSGLKIYPPLISLGQELPQNVEIECTSCYLRSDMSFSLGGDSFPFDYTPTPNFTSPYVQAAQFDFNNSWVGLAIESFEVHVELLIQLTPADDSNDKLEIHLLGEPRDIPVPDVPGLSVIFDPQIQGTLNVLKAVNFTYGFDIAVPSGSTILIPVTEPGNSIAVGFNETTITATPFQTSSRDIEIGFELSFRAAFSLGLESGFFNIDLLEGGTFAVFVDLPKLDVSVSQVKNATAACAPPSSSSERTFPQLTEFAPRIGMDVGLKFLDEEYTPLGFTVPLNNEAPVQCFEFDPERHVLVAPGSLDKDIEEGEDKGTEEGKDIESEVAAKNAVPPVFETPILLPLLSILTTALFA